MKFINRFGKIVEFNPMSQASITAAKAKAPGEGIGVLVSTALIDKIMGGEVTRCRQLPAEYRHLGKTAGLAA